MKSRSFVSTEPYLGRQASANMVRGHRNNGTSPQRPSFQGIGARKRDWDDSNHTDRQGEKLNWVTGPMGSAEPEGFLKVVAAG